MNPNETGARPDASGLDRREFLRLSGTLAATGALASAGCAPPQEATIPFHDMPESLVDGMGRARFFHTVIDGSPVLVRTREGRPILVAPSPTDASGRGFSVRHHAALMDLYDPPDRPASSSGGGRHPRSARALLPPCSGGKLRVLSYSRGAACT